MTAKDKKTRQQANRLRLADDLRSGIYRQYHGSEWYDPNSPDGRSVCFVGAAYETARRLQLTDRNLPRLRKLVADEEGYRVFGVLKHAYGFSFWRTVSYIHKYEGKDGNFERLAACILEMPPAGSPGLATRLRNRLTRLWRNAGAGLESARRRSSDRQPMPAPVPMPVDAARRRADLDARTPVPDGRVAPAPIAADVR